MSSITIHEIDEGLDRRLPVTDATAERFAASCMEHGCRLLSFDAHFAAIDGLLWVPGFG